MSHIVAFETRHISVEVIADGVFAALHREGGWAVGNAGIIDLGDLTVVFDTTLTPESAQDLKAAALELTGRGADLVVNSHYHNDHIWGNQVFADGLLVSTGQTRALIQKAGQEEYDWYKANAADRLADLRVQLESETDPDARRQLEFWKTYYEGLSQSMPLLELRLPEIAFERRLVLNGSGGTAELLAFEGGHTGNDVVLYLPREDILFAADLVFVGCHPYLADGDPEHLVRALDQLEALSPRQVVPGHGQVGTAEDIWLLKSYIVQLQDLGDELGRNNATEAEVGKQMVPEPFAAWPYGNFFHANLRFLMERTERQRTP